MSLKINLRIFFAQILLKCATVLYTVAQILGIFAHILRIFAQILYRFAQILSIFANTLPHFCEQLIQHKMQLKTDEFGNSVLYSSIFFQHKNFYPSKEKEIAETADKCIVFFKPFPNLIHFRCVVICSDKVLGVVHLKGISVKDASCSNKIQFHQGFGCTLIA